MAVKYTDSMIAELKAIPRLDYNTATAFAEKYAEAGVTSRSVIAKARALEIDYHAKDPKQRSASAKPKAKSKEDLTTELYELVGCAIPSATKMTAVDLQLLISGIKLRFDV